MAASFDPLDVLGKGPPPADVPPRRAPVRSAPLAGEADEHERLMTQQAEDAMDSIFRFCEAMERGVSIDELAEVMKLAIDEGHDRMRICLSMASIALDVCQGLPITR